MDPHELSWLTSVQRQLIIVMVLRGCNIVVNCVYWWYVVVGGIGWFYMHVLCICMMVRARMSGAASGSTKIMCPP